MGIKLTQKELEVLERKLQMPERDIRCPRCGNRIESKIIGNSSVTRCLSEGCIKMTCRGL